MEIFELLRRRKDPNKRLKWLTAEKPLVIVKPFHLGNNLEQTEDSFLPSTNLPRTWTKKSRSFLFWLYFISLNYSILILVVSRF